MPPTRNVMMAPANAVLNRFIAIGVGIANKRWPMMPTAIKATLNRPMRTVHRLIGALWAL
jgi:hypothetical protein